MKKNKTTGDLAVMDLTTLTVRTRAKTLAFQRQATSPSSYAATSCGYHLRSRRHVPPPPSLPVHDSKRHKHNKPNPSPRSSSNNTRQDNGNGSNEVKADGPRILDVLGSVSGCGMDKKDEKKFVEVEEVKDLGVEASLGENTLEFEIRERSIRESTPCSLIREPEAIPAPGSSTRPTTSTDANWRLRMRRCIPTDQEMDEFFAKAEKKKLQEFNDKYNFDPVTEMPLPGRYEWEKVDEDL